MTHLVRTTGWATLLVMLFAAAAPRGSGQAGGEDIERVLSGRRASFEFSGAPLEVVVGFIGRAGGVELSVDPALSRSLLGKNTSMTLRLREASLWNALQIVLDFTGARCVGRGGEWVVTENPAKFGRLREVTYDLRPITAPLRLERPRVPDLLECYRDSPPIETPWAEEEELADPDLVATLIRESLPPGTWQGEEVKAEVEGDRLKVVHTGEVHRQVEKVIRGLAKLREPAVNFHLQILRVQPDAVAGLRAGQALGPGVEERLVKAAADLSGEGGEYRIRMMNGERVHLDRGEGFTFLRGRRAGKALEGSARQGPLFDLQPLHAGGLMVPCMIRVALGKRAEGSSDLPSFGFMRAACAVPLEAGRTTLVAAASAPLGPQSGGPGGHSSVVLLRAEPDPWPSEEASLQREDASKKSIRAKLESLMVPIDYVETP
ncbi:MAG: hypothetical protein ACYTFG_22330, partial [Planctomycetota bacterium]